jgi:CHASE2 domain-containing sensor protein
MIRWLVSLAISLVGILGPALVPSVFVEDRIDALGEQLKAAMGFQSSHTAIIELRNGAFRWPIDRDTIGQIIVAALNDGAIAVGVDIDMSVPTDSDAKLLELVQRDERVVALRLPSATQQIHEANVEGFVFDSSAIFSGISCHELSPVEVQPFSVRIAQAAGITREALSENCIDSVLRPHVRSGAAAPPVVQVSEVLQHKGTLRDRVVILGTEDALGGVPTYNGIRSSTVVNANVIESALQGAWRRPSMLASTAIYGVLLLLLHIVQRQSRSTAVLLISSAGIAVIAVVARIWIWYPLLPALVLLVVTALWGSSRKASA